MKRGAVFGAREEKLLRRRATWILRFLTYPRLCEISRSFLSNRGLSSPERGKVWALFWYLEGTEAATCPEGEGCEVFLGGGFGMCR